MLFDLHGRIRPIEVIRQLGEEALDVLGRLKEVDAAAEPEYWLSVRHWASEASEAIGRDRAVDTWKRIAREEEQGTEAEDSFEDGMLAFTAFRGADPELVRCVSRSVCGGKADLVLVEQRCGTSLTSGWSISRHCATTSLRVPRRRSCTSPRPSRAACSPWDCAPPTARSTTTSTTSVLHNIIT